MGIALAAAACGASPAGTLPVARPEPDGRRHPELLRRGAAFARRGDSVRAAQYLTAALAAGADERVVTRRLLQIYVRSRRFRIAVERGEQYLDLHRRDHEVRFLVGALCAALGDDPCAQRHWETLVAEDPAHARALHALATLLQDHGSDSDRAAWLLRRYLELEPRGEQAEDARARLAELEHRP